MPKDSISVSVVSDVGKPLVISRGSGVCAAATSTKARALTGGEKLCPGKGDESSERRANGNTDERSRGAAGTGGNVPGGAGKRTGARDRARGKGSAGESAAARGADASSINCSSRVMGS